MAYDITQLKQDLEGIMHGTTLNEITNLSGVINRAARQVLLDVDPQETKRLIEIGTPIYNQVYDYPAPADLKGNKVIDIRPQVNRQAWDAYVQTYNETFDRTKILTGQPSFTIQFNTAIKTLRLANPQLQNGIIINSADNLNDNGTWSTFGDASSLSVDNVNYVGGNGSLQFNLNAAGSFGGVENSTQAAVNLSEQLNQGNEFWYVYLPNASVFTSIQIRWGSSATDYYQASATMTQANTVFQNGWNYLQVPWSSATTVGSPNPSSITYVRVGYAYDGTLQTGVRLDNIVSRMGVIMEIEYYSKFMFRDQSTGAFQETVTSDSNLINLDTETYNLLTYQVAYLAVQQQSGSESTFDSKYFKELYMDCLTRYKQIYKSEIIKPQESYYKVTSPNYRRNFGRRF